MPLTFKLEQITTETSAAWQAYFDEEYCLYKNLDNLCYRCFTQLAIKDYCDFQRYLRQQESGWDREQCKKIFGEVLYNPHQLVRAFDILQKMDKPCDPTVPTVPTGRRLGCFHDPIQNSMLAIYRLA